MANLFTREPPPGFPTLTLAGWLAFWGLLVWANYRDWVAIMSAITGLGFAEFMVLAGLRGAARVVGCVTIAIYFAFLLAIRG